ncbi:MULTISPECIES: tetratricopeptide repeat protein [Leeuwenhoekiella]|jgi:thioredoxin-like negative regulator of GroEL|uniref:tetratricopeptide repeat protein n=1 Tax=Leeuwenhoekiella TaxID=283735 RepID=UPI000C3C208F|nr:MULTISPECIES: tetratricopeptide repeat protein [Leeuwenhoekiella]MAO44139.1 hypothetical protein [Leeuwenhoekiella sp.]HCW63988.1 hypothetical protein [Leeuwenhoekiella sp.]|tara:strand:- start:3277 stop:5277 length:2001 start_codon:yes stop_codon:yes gene_type:complete
MRFDAFLKECQDKEVFKKLSIYAVFSWLVIQVISTVQQPMGLSPLIVTYVLILLLVGFPIYIFYIWKFQIAPIHKKQMAETGIVPEKRGFFGSKTPFQRYYFLSIFTISCLITFVLFFVIKNNFFNKASAEASFLASRLEIKNTDKIGVLKFGNNTGRDSLDIIGKMAADWIIHGITQKNIAQVVTPQIVEEYTSIIKAQLSGEEKSTVLQDYFKPAQIITGNYFLDGETLIFQSSITDGKLDETLISLEPVRCNSNNPLDCIEALKQRLLGYLITIDKRDSDFEEIPPKYEAYETFLKAKNTATYDENTIKLIEKAIEIDPEYFEPRLFQLTYYYDSGDVQKADSILKQISRNFNSNKRQKNIVKMYEALLEGNNNAVYRHLKDEYNIAPYNLNTNASMLAVALQYVNKPEVVDSVYQVIDTKDSNVESCYYCANRIYLKVLAKLQLKEYDSVIHYVSDIYQYENQEYFIDPLALAYLNLGKDPKVLFNDSRLILSVDQKAEFLLYMGQQQKIINPDSPAITAMTHLDELNKAQISEETNAYVAYEKKQYQNAIRHLDKLRQKDTTNLKVLGYLANAYAAIGNKTEAQQTIEQLDLLKNKYQYGEIDYLKARYYAVNKKDKEALFYLKRAVSAGYLYTIYRYQYDPHFLPYINTPEFNEIMTYWH